MNPAFLFPVKTISTLLLVLLAVFFPIVATAGEPKEQLELLRQNGIAIDTAGVVAYLQRLQPDPQRQVEIAGLIAELGDPEFARRKAATRKLATYGEAARRLLTEAAGSDDPEVQSRARRILGGLDAGSRLQESLTLAALEVLQSRRDPQSVPVVLATLAQLSDPHARGAAAEALWASADASHVDALTAALDHEDLHVRAAAMVALEVAAGEEAVPRIAPYLKSGEAILRLAAARALIDREPKQAVKALVEVADEEALDLSWQADALLQMKTGHRVAPGGDQSLGAAWKNWSAGELAGAKLDERLGERRLDLSAGRNTLEEDFAREARSLARGYGPFLYEADNGGPAKVAEGVLRIDGDNREGDQRLYITSRRMIGRERWPDQVEVRVKMAGEEGNNFGWHMGVSVGRVKTLFHPGLRGGAFRAELTDTHFYLFNNEMMSFQPDNDVMHEMIVRVRKTATGAEFDVTVNPGKEGKDGKPHKKKFKVTPEQLGDYNRIGLERSGRTGADALFDSISIRLGR